MELEFSWQIFENYSNIKFHENPSSTPYICASLLLISRLNICMHFSSLPRTIHASPLHPCYRVFNLKVDRILIWVIYLLRFTTRYVTQLTCIYSKCCKWCPFISMHLSIRFTVFLPTFLSIFFTSSMARVTIFAIALFTGACLLNFQRNFVYSGRKTLL